MERAAFSTGWSLELCEVMNLSLREAPATIKAGGKSIIKYHSSLCLFVRHRYYSKSLKQELKSWYILQRVWDKMKAPNLRMNTKEHKRFYRRGSLSQNPNSKGSVSIDKKETRQIFPGTLHFPCKQKVGHCSCYSWFNSCACQYWQRKGICFNGQQNVI